MIPTLDFTAPRRIHWNLNLSLDNCSNNTRINKLNKKNYLNKCLDLICLFIFYLERVVYNVYGLECPTPKEGRGGEVRLQICTLEMVSKS